MNFCSDNVGGAHPAVLDALAAANAGPAMPYGNDRLTARVEARLAEVFETDLAVALVATGTAANALGLSLLCPSFAAIACHQGAHVATSEGGAPEFYAGGARLVGLSGDHGRIGADALRAALAGHDAAVHQVPFAALSLSQATEAGTVYGPDAVAELAEIAHGAGLGVHMDGARFANAVAALDVSPSALTWKAGVDVLSFGLTKDGGLCAEAVVAFDPARRAELMRRRKRGGHLFSKMRFLAAQWDALLADDLWLANARHANAVAARLGAGLAALPGARRLHPVEANEVFVTLPEAAAAALEAAGFAFYRWPAGGPGAVRLVAAFDHDPADADALVATAREAVQNT